MERLVHLQLRTVVLLVITLVLALMMRPADFAQDRHPRYLVYIGTYTGAESKGIYGYRFDPFSGDVSSIGLAAESASPSFLAVGARGQFLYAVNEVDEFQGEKSGSVSAFSIDRSTGKLTFLNRVSSLGGGPAHLSLDQTQKYLLTANYGGGSVAAFAIENDGRIGKPSSFVQHSGSSVNAERQSSPHAHQIVPANDDRFVMVPDLGIDEVVIYKFDAAKGTLIPNRPGFAKTDPGAGPRHIALSPDGRFAYLANELQSTVSAFSYDAQAGSLRPMQTLSTLPKDFTGQNSAAEILTDAKGTFLYVSNRGHDSIAVFAVDAKNGTLSLVQHVPSGGRTPRNFAIDPSGAWLFAANQGSNDVVLFRVDSRTGRLTRTKFVLHVANPVCVVFVREQAAGR